MEQVAEGFGREDGRFSRLAVAVTRMADAREQPHRREWNRRPKSMARLGNETAATGL